MSIFVDVEELAANALIPLLHNSNKNYVSFEELDAYSYKVSEILLKSDKNVVFLSSRDMIIDIENGYSKYFEIINRCVQVKNNISINDLVKRFRGYLSIDMLKAYTSREALAIIGGEKSGV